MTSFYNWGSYKKFVSDRAAALASTPSGSTSSGSSSSASPHAAVISKATPITSSTPVTTGSVRSSAFPSMSSSGSTLTTGNGGTYAIPVLSSRKAIGLGHWKNEKQSAGGSQTVVSKKEMLKGDKITAPKMTNHKGEVVD